MLCQRCGRKNEPEAEACRFCKAPLYLVRPERGLGASDLQPFLGIEEYVLDKISTVEKQLVGWPPMRAVMSSTSILTCRACPRRASMSIAARALMWCSVLLQIASAPPRSQAPTCSAVGCTGSGRSPGM